MRSRFEEMEKDLVDEREGLCGKTCLPIVENRGWKDIAVDFFSEMR